MTDVLEVLKKLPPVCFIGPTEAKKLAIDVGFAIHRGIPGYTPTPSLSDETAARWNKKNGVSTSQIEAMQVGSMFGWHVPGADPDEYDVPPGCRMFLLCDNPATTTRPNTIIGDVPSCERCAARFDRLGGSERGTA